MLLVQLSKPQSLKYCLKCVHTEAAELVMTVLDISVAMDHFLETYLNTDCDLKY